MQISGYNPIQSGSGDFDYKMEVQRSIERAKLNAETISKTMIDLYEGRITPADARALLSSQMAAARIHLNDAKSIMNDQAKGLFTDSDRWLVASSANYAEGFPKTDEEMDRWMRHDLIPTIIDSLQLFQSDINTLMDRIK